MRVRLKIDNGKIVEGKDQLGAFIHSLNGDYIVSFLDLSSPNTIEEWRKLYFALRDIMHESVETGYTKNELHEEIKNHIYPKMLEQRVEEWFNNENWVSGVVSTTYLSSAGWKEYMKRFKEFAMDTFEIYI